MSNMSQGGCDVAEVEIVSCKLVGNNLAQVMKDRGLTVLETARRSGVVTARQLFRIRDGQNCPSLRLSVALSVVLDTKIEDLFTVTIITRSVAS